MQDDRQAVLFPVHGDGHSLAAAEALQLSSQVITTRVQSEPRHLGLRLSEYG
jgi:hypothetical protein